MKFNYYYNFYLGIRGVGSGLIGRDGTKQDSLEQGLTKNLGLSLQIEPKENVILGKKGITLSCNVNAKQEITWLHNGVEAPPCGISRCTIFRNGALHFYKVQFYFYRYIRFPYLIY